MSFFPGYLARISLIWFSISIPGQRYYSVPGASEGLPRCPFAVGGTLAERRSVVALQSPDWDIMHPLTSLVQVNAIPTTASISGGTYRRTPTDEPQLASWRQFPRIARSIGNPDGASSTARLQGFMATLVKPEEPFQRSTSFAVSGPEGSCRRPRASYRTDPTGKGLSAQCLMARMKSSSKPCDQPMLVVSDRGSFARELFRGATVQRISTCLGSLGPLQPLAAGVRRSRIHLVACLACMVMARC